MPHVSRRTFVAGLGASLVPWRFATAAAPKVVVVGAGLAGLAATYELQQAGVDVTLVEQSDRAGGRVKTVRGHFADHAWVDVGGQTTGAFYANFFYYSSVFGLEFEAQQEFRQRPDYLMHLHGNLLSGSTLRSDPAAWPVELHDHEKPLAPFRLVSHYLGPIVKEIGDVGDVLKPEFAQYDQMSLRQLLEQRGASEAAIRLVDHTANYNSADTVSALSVLRDQVRIMHMQGGQALNLDGGNDHLPAAFAKQVGDSILYRHSVRAVVQKEDSIEVRVEHDCMARSIEGDYVVIAIPFTALRKVAFEPGLPKARQSIIDELPYTQVLQAWIQTKTRFWESEGPVSMVISDGPLERLFNGSRQMKSERGLLINWINGTGTAAMRHGGADAQLDRIRREMQKIWPDATDQIETTLTNDWGESYAKGAYAHYAPGQLTAHAAEIPKPIGNIHFAGEHTELVAPGMEGALTSGKRTAAEILASLDI